MPEASKPNIHGYIHGRIIVPVFNTGGVEVNILKFSTIPLSYQFNTPYQFTTGKFTA
jgi:hypothetical protein